MRFLTMSFLFLFLLLVASGCVSNNFKYSSRDTSQIPPSSIRTFQLLPGETSICTEDGKPVIRMFSTTMCPHCRWINETFNGVMEEYVKQGKIVAYHWDADIGNNQFTPEKESTVPESEIAWLQKANPEMSVPTYVFGCKYWRVGNPYENANDLDAEAAEFKAVIEKLLLEVNSTN
ncbi:MAG: thioredoxin family protein [Candidatus Diapherotrites archaeon]|uniref:Thioredoxin family protein n=1 Tax=Candidatus Iainarchaeum sp. TaxID=3101447 RepID=A0A8T4C8S6_9ARCH|nr:thioredoxin family protein [Candidatus Diapherotrites archaeon]